MKEKIKKICLIIFYFFIWFVFIFSSFLVIVALSDIGDIKKWGVVLMVAILPFLSAYLVRHQFKLLKSKLVQFIRWTWEKENLYKLAIIIIVLSVLIIATNFIK